LLLVLDISTRRILHWNVTAQPTAERTVQQFRNVLTGEEPYRFIVHNNGIGPPIQQQDYDSEDWRLSLGNVDEIRYEVVGDPDQNGDAEVRITIRDPYAWHPGEHRGTQCMHRVMESQKERHGARDFISVGTATVGLRVGTRIR